ncbi:hypothetical protein MPTK1_7g02970 [Marchantia polymorpha subsp. ruderalis]|uniref:Uncharacterized protein n=2 Tax=Marchantia polymorpha TaxID=3197 RepID=A0AAF6BVK5_MARPO|nr:hypothetical protein MARPO_0524s0003 [Marchantia polymorpha]BBN16039.1 hypothetical protein Mp_7g02970 [Marchantia polymorpha subsp. ruderalis]|eukprot:PTQ26722.1 hypothetical protein MARPO_0524s0003 [Marchantia polymorpha]
MQRRKFAKYGTKPRKLIPGLKVIDEEGGIQESGTPYKTSRYSELVQCGSLEECGRQNLRKGVVAWVVFGVFAVPALLLLTPFLVLLGLIWGAIVTVLVVWGSFMYIFFRLLLHLVKKFPATEK